MMIGMRAVQYLRLSRAVFSCNCSIRRSYHSSHKQINFGLSIDIDGVIARGFVPFPEAVAAYSKLVDSIGKLRIPTCFLTNAISLNTYKAKQLTGFLQREVRAEQMVQAQGPLEMYTELHQKHCLFIGQGEIKHIAHELGFTRVCIIEDLTKAFPLLDVADHDNRFRVATSELIEEDFPAIEAVILLGEPKHWETDLQLLLDVILTNGKPSHTSYRQMHQTLPVIGCNLDLQFMHRAKFPRLGHGAFIICLESLFKKFVNHDIEYTALIGKPSETTYRYAENCLNKLARQIGLEKPLQTMYMIGDNIEADIIGGNLYKKYIESISENNKDYQLPIARVLPHCDALLPQTMRNIHSIQVLTGVKKEPNEPIHSHRDFTLDSDLAKPDVVVGNILDAIEYIFDRENINV